MNTKIILSCDANEANLDFKPRDLVRRIDTKVKGIVIGDTIPHGPYKLRVLAFFTSGLGIPEAVEWSRDQIEHWKGTITITNE